MTDKLTRAQREQIIFNHLKGNVDPLYDVIETKYGKYIVKPKQIELEEESNNEEENVDVKQPPRKEQVKDETNNRPNKRRTKQDAKRLLDALTSLINSDDSSYESSDEEALLSAPPLIEANNYKPTNLQFRKRRLAF